MATQLVRFQFRYSTLAEWTAADPVLAAGEPSFDTTTKALKVGDGVTPWTGLEYQTVDPAQLDLILTQVQAAQAAAEQAAEDAADAAASATGATDAGVLAILSDTTPPGNSSRALLDSLYAAIAHTHVVDDITDFNAELLAALTATLVPGSNVTITPVGSTLVIASTATGGGGLDAEALMDFLGGATAPGTQGIKGTGLVSVAYNDAGAGGAGVITISTTATANQTDSFLLNRANHTGSAAVWQTSYNDVSDTPATEGQLMRRRSGIWTPEAFPDLSRFPTKDTAGGGLNGLIRQFADIPDTPLPEGHAYVGPASGITLDTFDVTQAAEAFDTTTGRLLEAKLPLYHPVIHILAPGEPVPADTPLPYVVLRKGGGLILDPEVVDADFVQAGNTLVLTSGAGGFAVGDVFALIVGESGEATTPVEHTAAWATGVGPITNRSRGLSAGNAEVTIYQGVITTTVPPATNLTIVSKLPDGTTNQNRVHMMGALLKLPNIDTVTPFDQAQIGGGGSSAVLDKTLTFAGATAIPDELLLMALVNNYGTGGVTRPTEAVPPMNDLVSVLSAAASARNLWVGFRQLTTIEANAAATAHINASDGATGGWAAASASFRAA